MHVCALCEEDQSTDSSGTVWMLGNGINVHQDCLIRMVVAMRDALEAAEEYEDDDSEEFEDDAEPDEPAAENAAEE